MADPKRKLNLFDIVDLAKAGYKKKDIEEILSADIPEDNTKDAPEEKPAEESEPAAENGSKENAEGKQGDTSPDDNIDYKKLYEEKCAELEKAQKKNTQTNLSDNDNKKTVSIDDIVRSFM